MGLLSIAVGMKNSWPIIHDIVSLYHRNNQACLRIMTRPRVRKFEKKLRVDSGRVGSGRVGSGQVGWCRVESGGFHISRVGWGHS